jgi:cellulose synthase/poly-beta-1,6-N-acetylglucosamine synthase-like glycosyltransferase
VAKTLLKIERFGNKPRAVGMKWPARVMTSSILRHLKLNGARSRPAALDRGIESAEGNVITILDDDNLWDPDHLGNIVRDFNDADLVYKVCASRPSLLPVK